MTRTGAFNANVTGPSRSSFTTMVLPGSYVVTTPDEYVVLVVVVVAGTVVVVCSVVVVCANANGATAAQANPIMSLFIVCFPPFVVSFLRLNLRGNYSEERAFSGTNADNAARIKIAQRRFNSDFIVDGD